MRFSKFETEEQSLFKDMGLTKGTPVLEINMEKDEDFVFENGKAIKVYIWGTKLRKLYNALVDDKPKRTGGTNEH